MTFFYSIREGFDGLARAKGSAMVAILTMAGALIVGGLFALITLNMAQLVDALRARIQLEAFVDNSRDESDLNALRKQVEGVAGVASVRYVSREEAVEIFRREFGSDFIALLQSNPLPPSFRLTLHKAHQSSVAAQNVVKALRKLDGIEEVVYRAEFASMLDRYIGFAFALDLLIGLVVCVGAVFVVVNQVRLVAHAKRHMLETMALVGADRSFIQGPFLVQGLVHGLLGSGLAAAFFHLASTYWFAAYRDLVNVPREFYVVLLGVGVLLSLGAAYVGVRRYVN